MVKIFWQSVEASFENVYVTETIVWCLCINPKTIIFQCSKNYGTLTHTCNQFQSCLKHSRPDQSHQKLTIALMFVFPQQVIALLGILSCAVSVVRLPEYKDSLCK